MHSINAIRPRAFGWFRETGEPYRAKLFGVGQSMRWIIYIVDDVLKNVEIGRFWSTVREPGTHRPRGGSTRFWRDRRVRPRRGEERSCLGQNAFGGSGDNLSKVFDRVVAISILVMPRQARDLTASPGRRTDHVSRLPRAGAVRSMAASRSARTSANRTRRPSARSRPLSSIVSRGARSDGVGGGSGSGKMSRGSSMGLDTS
jgi:hypothetical protein